MALLLQQHNPVVDANRHDLGERRPPSNCPGFPRAGQNAERARAMTKIVEESAGPGSLASLGLPSSTKLRAMSLRNRFGRV